MLCGFRKEWKHRGWLHGCKGVIWHTMLFPPCVWNIDSIHTHRPSLFNATMDFAKNRNTMAGYRVILWPTVLFFYTGLKYRWSRLYTPSHPDLFSVRAWMSGGFRKNCPKGWKCRGFGAMGAVCLRPASTLDSGCATKHQNGKHFLDPGCTTKR